VWDLVLTFKVVHNPWMKINYLKSFWAAFICLSVSLNLWKMIPLSWAFKHILSIHTHSVSQSLLVLLVMYASVNCLFQHHWLWFSLYWLLAFSLTSTFSLDSFINLLTFSTCEGSSWCISVQGISNLPLYVIPVSNNPTCDRIVP